MPQGVQTGSANRRDRSLSRALKAGRITSSRQPRNSSPHLPECRRDSVKGLFLEIATRREQFAADVLSHAQRLGGATESEGSLAGALRGGMTLKDAVGGHDDAAIIREAERGERSALAA